MPDEEYVTTVELDGEPVTVTDESGSVITLRFVDWRRMRLLAYELQMLTDEMRVMASPHAERLDHIIGRFLDGDDDPQEED